MEAYHGWIKLNKTQRRIWRRVRNIEWYDILEFPLDKLITESFLTYGNMNSEEGISSLDHRTMKFIIRVLKYKFSLPINSMEI